MTDPGQIATDFFLQCILKRSLDQHTKMPRNASWEIMPNLHKSNMAAKFPKGWGFVDVTNSKRAIFMILKFDMTRWTF